MTDMHSFLTDLLAETPDGQRELLRARLRVAVAEDLLLRMEALHTSKAQLAAALGVSRSAVSQALTGTRNMSLNLLADMAGALGLNARVVLEAESDAAARSITVQPPAAAPERTTDVQTAGSSTQGTLVLQTIAGRYGQPAGIFVTGTSAVPSIAGPAHAGTH